MDFLSEQLVATDYRDRLNSDLQRADVCRFLVGYISADGLNSLDRLALVAALRNDQSFGVSSLTCACGYSPLLQLQRDVGGSIPRLASNRPTPHKSTVVYNQSISFTSKLIRSFFVPAATGPAMRNSSGRRNRLLWRSPKTTLSWNELKATTCHTMFASRFCFTSQKIY